LYRIGVNVCLNRVTSKAPRLDRMQTLDAAQHPDTGEEHAEEALLRKERAERVREAIATLPPKQRATLILRMYHDLPHEQIAGILGSSVGASKANLFHALNRLRAVLQS
jgi:RNA polymerase sigma-70 factor (ECF subfamily)